MFDLSQTQLVRFFNKSSEQIPAFGVVRATGMRFLDGQLALECAKSNAYAAQYSHFVNGRLPVEEGEFGLCSRPGFPVWAACEAGIRAGDLCGPVDDSFELKRHVGGFVALADPEDDRRRVLVTAAPLLMVRGKALLSISKNATGTVVVYHAQTETEYTINAYNVYGDVLASADVRCDWLNNQWEIGMAECVVD